MVQASARVDYDLTPDVVFTSLTSYIDYTHENLVDYDGQAVRSGQFVVRGDIESFFQELRLTGTMDRFRWIVGANYSRDKVLEDDIGVSDVSSSFALQPFTARFVDYGNRSFQDFRTIAVFADAQFEITDQFTVFGGVRYTEAKDRYNGCSVSAGDESIGIGLAGIFSALRAGNGLGPVTIPPGGCVTADASFNPGELRTNLDEDNIPWRAGIEFTPRQGILLYGTVSKGFKQGSFPVVSATATVQLAPAVQEELQAYELGAKLSLLDRTLQLNGALFRYDYTDKQVRGRTAPLPPFGALETLVNVPESRIDGAELSVVFAPVDTITFTGGVTYLDSEVRGSFLNYNPLGGGPFEFRGEELPLTPKWQVQGDLEYRPQLNESLDGMFGVSVNFRDKTRPSFGTTSQFVANPGRFDIDAYSLIDLRAGVGAPDNSWQFNFYVRNVTDKYYWTNVFRGADTINRYAGMPRTFGAIASFRFD